MTTPSDHEPVTGTAQHSDFSLQRISRLIADLEQELAKAPPDIPHGQELREEIETLKHVLASPGKRESGINERLHAIRGALEEMSAKVEGEVLKDTPYITEIGRILGMV